MKLWPTVFSLLRKYKFIVYACQAQFRLFYSALSMTNKPKNCTSNENVRNNIFKIIETFIL